MPPDLGRIVPVRSWFSLNKATPQPISASKKMDERPARPFFSKLESLKSLP